MDPYQRVRAYSGTSQIASIESASYSHDSQPQPNTTTHLNRQPSFNDGDDSEYFDGGTGVARRQSVLWSSDGQYYNNYGFQPPSAIPLPPPPPQDRRGSVNMVERSENPGNYFAVTPAAGNGNSSYNQQYLPPNYRPSIDGTAPNPPYPINSTFNETSAGPTPAPAHQPYNPAAYHPQRSASTVSTVSTTGYAAQRHASIAVPYSPTTGSYDPSAYNSAPYPSSPSYRVPVHAQQPTSMTNAPARYSGYPQYGGRPSYTPTQAHSYMSPTQSYSPGLPPVSSSSAPPQQNSYHAPPPPPPPHPPSTPGYPTTYQPPMQSSLSYSTSERSSLTRPETHYISESESDVPLQVEPSDTSHHPLPSPPKDRSLPLRDYRPSQGLQRLPSPPSPRIPPTHVMSSRQDSSRPLPLPPRNQVPNEEDLYSDIEAELMGMGTGQHRQSLEMNFEDSLESQINRSYRRNGTNGYDTQIGSVYDCYSTESDAEAAAGLAMMQHDEQEAIGRNRHDSVAPLPPPPPSIPLKDHDESDLDYAQAGVDIGGFGGEFFSGMGGFYGSDTAFNGVRDNNIPFKDSTPVSTLQPHGYDLGRANSSSSAIAKMHRQAHLYDMPGDVSLHPFPDFSSSARVDTGGTGGFAEPSLIRRMSFEEGDEAFDRSNSGSPAKRSDSDDNFPELFYHPPSSASISSPVNPRPLPSPPYKEQGSEWQLACGEVPPPPYPEPVRTTTSQPPAYSTPSSPGFYSQMHLGAQQPYIPRTTSLTENSNTPQAFAPVRSKTDGRINTRQNRNSMHQGSGLSDSEIIPALTPSDLPAIPLTRKFDPKKLSSRDFRRCTMPWALSAISAWLEEITEGDQDLKEALVADAVVALFTHYVPTMNVADAETLAAKIVTGMLKEKSLVKEEEWVKFGPGEVSGVIYQITGNGCYAPRVHEFESPIRCYAHHCARTLRKISLPQHGEEPKQRKEDWAIFWKIKKEDVAEIGKKEVERQNNLHEIVQTEEEYMEQMKVLKVVYRDQIENANPPIIKPTRIEAFVRDVFGKAEAVRKVSEEHLLPQLKFRQREQGPWIVGFSDIFREWIRKAKTAYLDYAAAFPKADMLVRRESDRNIIFRQFLESCRQDPRTRRLDWVTFLKGPITRLQRYSLLLTTVWKHTTTETEEKQNLERAIEEIKAVTLDCDTRVDEMSKRVQLLELGSKLIMRQWNVDLRLEEKGRELIFRGDLQRTGNNRFTWLETHCILFDHYLVLAKMAMQKEAGGGTKHERYDVSRMPIPMDLLVLESTNDDPVVRGAANRLYIAGPTVAAKDPKSGRHNTVNTVPTLPHALTSSNLNSNTTTPGRLVTSLPEQNARDDKILYPFKIKHLGNPTRILKTDDNTYILYAPSAANRKDWCDRIIASKERHAASLHAQNAEPFRLKVMADSAFGYENNGSASSKPTRIRLTPLDRAISEVETLFESLGPRPPVICRGSVNCATAFTASPGREMVAIGTDSGVYTAESNNPRGWTRVITAAKVNQIAVLEEFNLFLVLADKSLVAYHLDAVVQPAGSQANSSSKQKTPQRLSGNKDVGFFATGRMKDRVLVFYKKREGLSSTFKVLEPIVQKCTEKKSRFSRKGTTEFFRDFDEFYIPTDCYGINIFHSSLAIQTSKGIEVMTLDKKQPWSVPELRADHLDNVAARLQSQKPLGMFRLSDIEFLLCYEECAVYVNKHGDVSRSVIMEFVGKANTVAMYGPYVLVFDQDFVEVRNAQNGRLRQVINGRDVKCLDDAMYGGSAGGNGRTVKVGLAHPEVDGRDRKSVV